MSHVCPAAACFDGYHREAGFLPLSLLSRMEGAVLAKFNGKLRIFFTEIWNSHEDDREFMTRLYLDYSRLMQQQITKIVQDEWAAEDLMQTTLVKLIDKVQDLRTKDRNHLINYIISACKNQARNYMRDKNRHAEYSIDEYLDMPNPHDGADEIEMRLAYTDELEHLSKVWPKLDGRSRYLLESHYILEKSPYEIAANLGIKPDSVRMALTRARKAAYALLAKG